MLVSLCLLPGFCSLSFPLWPPLPIVSIVGPHSGPCKARASPAGCAFGHHSPLLCNGPTVTFRVSAVLLSRHQLLLESLSLRPHFHPRKRKAPLPSGLQVSTCPTPASGHSCNENVLTRPILPSQTGPSLALGSHQGLPVPVASWPVQAHIQDSSRLLSALALTLSMWPGPHHIHRLPLPRPSLLGSGVRLDGTLNRGSRRGPPGENSLSYGLPTRPSHPERLPLRLREGTHAYVTSHRANVGSATASPSLRHRED